MTMVGLLSDFSMGHLLVPGTPTIHETIVYCCYHSNGPVGSALCVYAADNSIETSPGLLLPR